MAAPRPAIVLSGGGARAAYQVGVLRHLGKRNPGGLLPIITGVSAGAINAVYLASHTGSLDAATGALRSRWEKLTIRRVFRYDPFTLASIALRWLLSLASGGTRIAPRARSLVNTRPLRAFLERSIDVRGIDENLARGRIRAVAVSATSYRTGQTVTWVHGDPPLPLWERPGRRAVRDRLTIDHVMASSALPLLFPAVEVNGGYFGDGSIRQIAPLAPAIHLGADRVLSVSARYARSIEEARRPAMDGYPAPAQVLGLLFNNIFLDALHADAARLDRINRVLERCRLPDRSVDDLRQVGLLVLRPSRDLGELATDYADRLPRTVRYMVGGLGGREGRTSDFVSYLLFEEGYLKRLMDLGERDAEEQWPRIARFLGWEEGTGGRRREESAS